MKKYVLGFLLVSSLGLAACTSNDSEEASVSAQSTEQTTTESTEEEPEATFEDGVFDNDSFTLTYEDAQIINSPMEDGPGLYVTYTLKNKLDENINPQEILDTVVIATQENDTSEVDLPNNYYSLDAFGPEEDTDTYNEQVDKENAVSDDLKPGKEVEIVNSFGLDNKENPVQLQMLIDPEAEEYSDPYEIKLEDLEEIPEPEGEEKAETEEETPTEENEEPESNESTEQEETFVPEEPGVDSDIAQRYQDAIENKGMSEDEAYDYANAPYIDEDAEEELEGGEYYDYEDEDDFDDEISEEEAEANIEQVEQFRKNFKEENGREPTSGEIQSQW
ncbi:DUF5067 domain-containing protein [Tetragenococcus halophilus]|uniref:DUF5067 domain-containing protein n=1 Tax=Tetragenococcus halophilus TaxID=51669 RepID=UPI0030CA06C7